MRNSRGIRSRLRRSRGRRAAVGIVAVLTLFLSACSNSTPAATKSGGNTVVTMWSWLSASDAQVWGQMIKAFNKANDNKGLHEQIKLTPVVSDYTTKIVSAVTAGDAPDFGWASAGLEEYQWAKEGVIVPLTSLAKQVGLNLSDFSQQSLADASYPSLGGKTIYMVPTDLSDFALEINVKEAKAAGLNPADPPTNAQQFLKWAEALTIRKNGKIVQSGLGSDLAGVATTYWGIVAAQYGFQRVSSNGKTACVDPAGGAAAMNWLLNLFYKYKVINPTTTLYQSFDTGQSAMMMEGPWTIFGNNQAGLDWEAAPLPVIGSKPANYFEDDGLEVYKQKNTASYKATMEAIKWLSDNSWPWVTGARGVTPRLSLLHRSDYDTTDTNGFLPKYRLAYINGMKYANVASIPGPDMSDFEYYEVSPAYIQTEVSRVLAHQLTVPNFMSTVCAKWQSDINSGGVLLKGY
jgi:ABC-type glycerol-3-phosphate transport system substrate-binding protein